MNASADAAPLRLFVVAGEASGDELGAKLMVALRKACPRRVVFTGVGGARMTAQGLTSLFPMSDIAVMGIVPVIQRLPLLLRRIRETADAAIASRPDALLIIDSPDFTHRVARRVRRVLPQLPVIDYVSPTVWAWRTGRAKAMRAYVDHVLALLPFEPAAHEALGGPPCTYVGHPLIERVAAFQPSRTEEQRRLSGPPLVLVLPGSRRSEIRRLTAVFGAAIGMVGDRLGALDVVLPAVDHLADDIAAAVADWPIRPTIVRGEAAKLAAFRQARAALAASGTVTLELGLAGVPMVVAYKVTAIEMWLRFLVKVPSIVLVNLIAGGRSIPEFIGEDCTPVRLAAALIPLIEGGEARDAQEQAFARLMGAMHYPSDSDPSHLAAVTVLQMLHRSGRSPRLLTSQG